MIVESTYQCDVCDRSLIIRASKDHRYVQAHPEGWSEMVLTESSSFHRSRDSSFRPSIFLVCSECLPPDKSEKVDAAAPLPVPKCVFKTCWFRRKKA